MSSTIKVKDDGQKIADDMDWSAYRFEQIRSHYERMGFSMVSSNISMALSVSGASKEQKGLTLAVTVGFEIARIYMGFKDMLLIQSRVNYMRKMTEGTAAYTRATGMAVAESAISGGILVPAIVSAIAAAVVIIAAIYSIPQLEKGGVITDSEVIPLEQACPKVIIRNKIYYMTEDTIPIILNSNKTALLGAV